MVLGKEHWRIVSSDHIGVPHGGLFGDVRRWEPLLNKHGLYLYWSLVWQTFGIYTKLPDTGEIVNQMLLKHKDGGPIPIDRSVVDTFVFLRDSHSYTDQPHMISAFKARKEAEARRANDAMAEERRDVAKNATSEAFLNLGLRSPKVITHA